MKPTRYVKLKETGQKIRINEADFDEKVHAEWTEPKPKAKPKAKAKKEE